MSERLDAIRDRLAKATPGPWETVPTTGNAVVSPDGDGYWTDVADRIESESDAGLIANAPTDLAYLLERNAEAEKLIAEMAAKLVTLSIEKADAWDEGWAARAKRPHLGMHESVPAPSHINPYRKDQP